MSDHPLLLRLPRREEATPSLLLDRFWDYLTARRLELYPAQEEAILELLEGRHVILNTPTGSGKSLVATALHFRALALGRRSVYTCPIKALVNEKFLALCRDFGPENVGMATGDATVNRDAPILCCTAEILAQDALRYGVESEFTDVIMDEFHYYADRERGVAWQVPLLTLERAQFLLMSATLGNTTFFATELERLTRVPCTVVAGRERPVPLEYSYVETSVETTVASLMEQCRAPVYVVHFSQNDASQRAQDLMSMNFCTPAEKNALKEALVGQKFTSPFGKEVRKFLAHGIGIHHAGLLPKYRVLVESLALKGLLKVICGTDTLGVGVNVPIRTVLMTRLTKYDGQKTRTLTVRDFHQITGRAGRKGFDDIGYVMAVAPEHVVENAKLAAKAGGDEKKLRKMVKKKPPEGFVGWSEETYGKLQAGVPEPLTSHFSVTHGMLLHVLSRSGDGCRALQSLIRDSHETPAAKKEHRARAWQLFRALRDQKIIEVLPRARSSEPKLRVNVALQDDFSLTHELSLYLIHALSLLDPNGVTYAVDILSLCEAILENPDVILQRQLNKLKTTAMNEMKAEGIPYEERLARLEELEYPKPCRDFIYSTFNDFAALHPWVGRENIRPKSIAREMYEEFRTFADYIHDYDLHRAEGVLLRHLSSVYKVLAQTVPSALKNELVDELEAWLAGMLRGTDSSLLDEWEKLKDPQWQPKAQVEGPSETHDITRSKREFTALVRTAVFRFFRPLALEDYVTAAATLEGGGWSAERLGTNMDAYYTDHERILLDPEARNLKHTYVMVSDDQKAWEVSQVLVDGEGVNDWQAVFRVDLAVARENGKPVLELLRLGAIAAAT